MDFSRSHFIPSPGDLTGPKPMFDDVRRLNEASTRLGGQGGREGVTAVGAKIGMVVCWYCSKISALTLALSTMPSELGRLS